MRTDSRQHDPSELYGTRARGEMAEATTPCRLHVILAREANVGVVFRRGPTDWWHILKWDLARFDLESGAWFKGTLYPTRSAVSCDGQVLAYFAMHGSWDTYLALSKPPWLSALCAWKTVGTWTTGAYFAGNGKLRAFGALCENEPFHGTCPFPYEFGGVDTNWNRAKEFQFLVNGWKPKGTDGSGESFEPGPHDVTELTKGSPRDPGIVLTRYAEFGSCLYSIIYPNRPESLLPDIVWADFDRMGRVVAASAAGELKVHEVRDSNLTAVFSQELNSLQPTPVEAPPWAKKW